MAMKGLLGKEGKDSKERTTRKILLERKERTSRKGQRGKDSEERTAKKGRKG